MKTMTVSNPSNLPAYAKGERTFDQEVQDRYLAAANANSWSGHVCQFTGGIGVVIGGVVMLASIASGSGYAILGSAGIAALGAIAGAPVAALGSIAISTKRNTRLNELNAWLEINKY